MRRTRLGVLCALLLLALATAAGAGAVGETVRITNATYLEGDAATRGDVVYVWESSSQTLETTFAADNASGTYAVCIDTTPDVNASSPLACRDLSFSGNGEQTLTFEFDAWPGNENGTQEVLITVRNGTANGPVMTEQRLPVRVIQQTGDLDDDSLSNEEEVSEDTNLTDPDTDGDGLSDGEEVNTYGTNPNKPDTDGDGLSDGDEIREYETDPTQSDTDDDGLADAVELREHGTNPNKPDTDGDGLNDGKEVNTYETDPTQADTDGDGLSDGEEVNTYETNPNKPDTDGDGLSDGEEVNTYGTNPNKPDTDGDGLSDGAEVNEYNTDPNAVDSDGDGIPDNEEVDQPLIRVGTTETLSAGLFLLVAGVVVVLHRTGRLALPQSAGTNDDPEIEAADEPVGEIEADGMVGPQQPQTDTEILTDEDRILSLLDTHGGRMRQSAIVGQTDWSKSKVSRMLSEMEDDDLVTKISVGRENIIARPGAEPDITRSPHEDEE